MMATKIVALPKSEGFEGVSRLKRRGAGPGGPVWGGGDGRGPNGFIPLRAYHTGVWLALAAIVMLFAGLTSALVVRKGISSDWAGIALPSILYLNTSVLVSSSLVAEWARRRLRPHAAGKEGECVDRNLASSFGLVVGLGIMFLVGQLVAWRELAGRGIFLATNPSSSFFYLLTAAHALHLAGGLVAIGYVAWRAKRLAATPRGRAIVDVAVIYWHFCGGLWIYLLALLAAKM